MNEKKQVLFGRVFVISILAITYILSLVSNRSIFKLGVWSFTGFASLLPVVLAALFWKRSTKQGAFASVLSVVALWSYFFIQGGARCFLFGGDSRLDSRQAIWLLNAGSIF